MLILTRKCDQELRIGQTISVKVLDASDGRVKLGVRAPAEVCIRRLEQLASSALDCGPVLVSEPESITA